MKILITGASGFIGKNLIHNKFFLKHETLVLTSRKIKGKKNTLRCKIQNIDSKIEKIKNFNPEVVIHLAWHGIPDYGEKMSLKNYFQQIRFFKALKKISSIQKIIVTGSCFEYGILKGKASESKKINSFNFFSKAKINIYKYLIKNFSKKKIIWLRLFYVYGKKQRNKALIPYLIKKLKSNKDIKLNEPYAARDFINVDDVSNVIIKFLKINRHGIFNVGTGIVYSPLNIINLISKKIRSKSKISYDKNKLKTKFSSNTKKLKSIYPHKLLSLKKTIAELIQEY